MFQRSNIQQAPDDGTRCISTLAAAKRDNFTKISQYHRIYRITVNPATPGGAGGYTHCARLREGYNRGDLLQEYSLERWFRVTGAFL